MKNYICKDCTHNNNGWCSLKKQQGLKNITACSEKSNNDSKPATEQHNNLFQEMPEGPARVMGKIESLYSLLTVVYDVESKGLSDAEKYEALKKQLLGVTKIIQVESKIQQLEDNLNSVIDADILNAVFSIVKEIESL